MRYPIGSIVELRTDNGEKVLVRIDKIIVSDPFCYHGYALMSGTFIRFGDFNVVSVVKNSEQYKSTKLFQVYLDRVKSDF